MEGEEGRGGRWFPSPCHFFLGWRTGWEEGEGEGVFVFCFSLLLRCVACVLGFFLMLFGCAFGFDVLGADFFLGGTWVLCVFPFFVLFGGICC